jgi:carnosine N-methyltransferase
VLKNLARDWSAEGRAERSEAYEPMLEELETLVPICSDGSTFRPDVLIPGAGLGRMCLEAVRRGYNAQGSEFSYFMLLASSFMLNSSSPAEPLVVHPWMHTSLNHLSDESMLREVLCPEVDPVEHAGNTDATMSMCAGDFVEVYTKAEQENSWDAILSCFFLDTAQNFVDYLEAMYNALKPGGVLINFGPLLFHWAEHASEMASNDISIEASWETVKSVALQVGFHIRREEMRWCTYTTDRNSMLQSMYNVVFATFVKPNNGPRRVYSNAAAMQGIPQHCDSANAEQPNGDPNERESVDHQNKHH